ncbi:hypothetical protein VT06_11070 [Arsukibacterium sp. MJ3]|uniref:hypothetical protein n=1 Tax=Arsukibacterium sp. MJ3 TaxID=1632859 RepID=UPI000626FE46|nr:hypothetical protein [Arsukibacterium sp. MJ3]KKO48624.1 hypothetical protein VT06_11070 [Arsukibacterium sp. MJ3]
MKTLATLTFAAGVLLAALPTQANPVTEVMQQLAASQLAEIKTAVVQQARQAVEQTATDLRQLLQTTAPLTTELVAVGQDAVVQTNTKPAAE